MKTSELKGAALDWAVALASGATDLYYDTIASWWFKLDGKDRTLSKGWAPSQRFNPSTEWACGGPIIERECISVKAEQCSPRAIEWEAELWPDYSKPCAGRGQGPTALIAAMRCYVASKLGDEVGLPEGLTR